MKIGGFQKMTLLDYPGKVACTIFLSGCNLRCPFCHNALLVTKQEDTEISAEYIFNYLRKRQGILDGVCFTGGEPLLNNDINLLMGEIKKLGYKIKVDTNGTRPEKLREVIEKGLVDYVAMDIKNCEEKYSETTGVKLVDFTKIRESIDLLINGNIDYEFRTTVVDRYHTVEDIRRAAELIKGAKRYFLQGFVDSGELIGEGMGAVSKETMEEMKKAAEEFISEVQIRGV